MKHKIPRPYKRFGAYLKKKRIECGLTQSIAAKHLGYASAQHISNIEAGIMPPPIKKFKLLISLLGLSVNKTIKLYQLEKSQKTLADMGL